MSVLEKALPEFFTAKQLCAIQNSHIAIAGVGGLGSNAAMQLVRSGFRRLTLIDFDCVSPSNLNRQFYFAAQIGRLKVEALSENLLRINPALELKLINEYVTSDNINALFCECPIVIEAFDNAAAKKLLAETLLPSKRLLVGASGIAGHGLSTEIKSHRLRDNFFVVGDLQSEVTKKTPPLAPRVALAAAMQADIVLSFILQEVSKEEPQ